MFYIENSKRIEIFQNASVCGYDILAKKSKSHFVSVLHIHCDMLAYRCDEPLLPTDIYWYDHGRLF
jgi:hypothetical protein